MANHIDVSFVEELPAAPFEELVASLQRDGLEISHEARPMPGPFMAVEWLVPTAAFVYLSKPYFEAFLKEAGKDHYTLLKNGLSRLGARLLGKGAPQVTLYHSGGKAKSSQQYSLTYSIVAELEDGISAKLLMQTEATADTIDAATQAFLDFLNSFHQGSLEPSSVSGLESTQPVGRMLLFAFNHETGKLEVVDPIPRHIREKQAQA
jgi:hypothetical protein